MKKLVKTICLLFISMAFSYSVRADNNKTNWTFWGSSLPKQERIKLLDNCNDALDYYTLVNSQAVDLLNSTCADGIISKEEREEIDELHKFEVLVKNITLSLCRSE